ncbi:MAG: hypothetical protein ACHREM_21840, partial [Polyangiales bacterium]
YSEGGDLTINPATTSITVSNVTPTSGTFTMGNALNVGWTSSASSSATMSISLKRDICTTGTTCTVGDANYQQLTTSVSNSGSYSTTIPTGIAAASDWRVYVKENVSGSYSDGGDITIAAAATDAGAPDASGSTCGNNIAEGDEQCDGTDLRGNSCAVYTGGVDYGGTLRCNGSCTGFDNSACCVAPTPSSSSTTPEWKFGIDTDDWLTSDSPIEVTATIDVTSSSSAASCTNDRAAGIDFTYSTRLGPFLSVPATTVSSTDGLTLTYDDKCQTNKYSCPASGGAASCDWSQECCTGSVTIGGSVGKSVDLSFDATIPIPGTPPLGFSFTAGSLGYTIDPTITGSLNHAPGAGCGCSGTQYELEFALALAGQADANIKASFELAGYKIPIDGLSGLELKACAGIAGTYNAMACNAPGTSGLSSGARVTITLPDLVVGGFWHIVGSTHDLLKVGDGSVCGGAMALRVPAGHTAEDKGREDVRR